ncbi:MAG: hypothetical protein ABI016_06780 [Chthoniobacterales bacterium]
MQEEGAVVYNRLSDGKQFVKRTFRILAPLVLLAAFDFGLTSCGPDSTGATGSTASGPAAPMNEVDVLLNDYDKSSTEYIRMSRKLKGGDLSVTVLYLEAKKDVQSWPAKLQAAAGTMSPGQAQRAAEITAKTAPHL